MDDKIITVVVATIGALLVFNGFMLRFFISKVTKLIDLIPVIESFQTIAKEMKKVIDEFSVSIYRMAEIEKKIEEIKKDMNSLKEKVHDIESYCKLKNHK